ncbi:stage III sporulation protein AF [Clostridium sp. UBA1056]|uniref:stage III sporulation protein AF n=1 Tax=unclassified Clostridium TaxID=2614128 RepID=UPI0032166D73
MIEALGEWIITICVAIFFTTAVQMILPDNSLKKYCNFVLGLIVFVVILSPIVKIFNKDLQINKIIKESADFVFNDMGKGDYEEYRQANINNTLERFKKNLEKQCITDLEKNFKEDKYSAKVKASYDTENSIFIIERIEVGINDGSVERVKKVQIGDESVQVDNQDSSTDKKSMEIRDFISSKYDIDQNNIYVYKLNNN